MSNLYPTERCHFFVLSTSLIKSKLLGILKSFLAYNVKCNYYFFDKCKQILCKTKKNYQFFPKIIYFFKFRISRVKLPTMIKRKFLFFTIQKIKNKKYLPQQFWQFNINIIFFYCTIDKIFCFCDIKF